MPETTMNEDDRMILRKNYIRLAWKPLVIYSVAEAMMPEGVTKLQLRPCVNGMYGGHVVIALLRR
jgi:hypothetical protein